MAPKDLFSGHAKLYAAFRPTYPHELYDFIFNHLKHRRIAWDCATGNGQVAQHLAHYFDLVLATDISAKQLNEAVPTNNVQYSVSTAEQTTFPDNHFDLITVGQALHWIDREKFYAEVNRVSKSNSLLAVWGYGLLSVDETIDLPLNHFYKNVVGPYWDAARKLVDDAYATIEFPFEEIPSPKFFIEAPWTIDHFAGYLESWSATQKYISVRGANPVTTFMEEIQKRWRRDEVKKVSFPIFLRLGKIKK